MSYILEALKKAEAERERSQVPGLSTAQNNSTIYITHQGNSKAWWIAGALALSLALVVGAWVMRSPAATPDTPQPVAASQPAAPVVAPAPAPAVPPVVAPAASPVAKELPRSTVAPVVAATAPVVKPEPLKAPAPIAATMAPATTARTNPAPAPVPAATPVPVAPAAAPVPAAPNAVAKAAPSAPVETVRPASNGVPQFSDLPETLRRQIPALHISGAVYSDSPPEWTLIINDQVMSRGSLVAPDVRLEEVTASSATFNFKGQRFRMDR